MKHKVDQKVYYSKTHEWVRIEGGEAVIGISDYAQDRLSDVVLVDLPLPGKDLRAGVTCLFIETMAATEEVFAPVSGSVIARNEALEKKPELVNSDPFGEGWLLRVKLSAPTEADCLMDPATYSTYTSDL